MTLTLLCCFLNVNCQLKERKQVGLTLNEHLVFRRFQQQRTTEREPCLEELRIEYDVESEYSGEVSSWRSRDDSLDLLTTCDNSLDPLTSDGDLMDTSSSSAGPLVTLDYIASTPIVPRDPRRWTRDKLCQSFGLTTPVTEVREEDSSLDRLDLTTPGCVSETVDSIEYFSPRYSPSTEASAEDTVVMVLTTEDEGGPGDTSEAGDDIDESEVSDGATVDTAELLSLLHLIHTEEENFDEEILR